MRSTARVIVTTAGVLGFWIVGMTAAGAQTVDQHAGVPSNQGPRDVPQDLPLDVATVLVSDSVATPAPAAAPQASAAAPAPQAPTSSALPVTGSDVIAITGLGLGLVATGFVVKRRYSS